MMRGLEACALTGIPALHTESFQQVADTWAAENTLPGTAFLIVAFYFCGFPVNSTLSLPMTVSIHLP